MEQNCIQRIRDIYSSLKGAEKKVAEYILKNPKDIIHFSITELSDVVGCGDATIIRLCKKLGYKGYQELKIKIASEVISPIEDIHEEIKEDDDEFIIMQKVFNSNIYSLNQTLKLNDYNLIKKAIDILLKSTKIAFFGMGGSAALAYDFYHKFLRTGKWVEFSDDGHVQAMIASRLSDKDCIIAISNTGSNKELIENINIAKSNDTKIITITANNKSPISKVSDIVLISYGKESDFKSEAMESRISALSLIDTIFVGYCMRDKDNYIKNLKKVRNAIALKRF
ncbi:MurR/RpiR family transcriptional regulator [Caloramator australicus]|uniref:Sialic acid utilization regulator, RpiR family n=1 Tax=Caloramator australicus RC3 TaxID=857293 RepID=I7LFU9_9CLOT|nr:MurR/RpiR family transcriptional regulator [Caloramator australicus]CCJ32805.1 Sialic acid utilization regulator, RpiR family [Caloramator australicus RC3]